MADVNGSPGGPAWLQRVPAARWLADYRVGWLRGDVIAGVTLAAYAIPVSLAYATLAGLPPQVGVYGYLLGGIGYALLGSSRQLAIGPTSAISLMIAGTVGAMAGGDADALRPDREPGGLHRRRAVRHGVGAAAERARQADQRQHPGRLQGRRGAHHRDDAACRACSASPAAAINVIERAAAFAGQIGRRPASGDGRGLGAIALLVLGERLLPGRPVALAVVALSIVAVLGVRPRRARRADDRRDSAGAADARGAGAAACAMSRASSRWPPAACCSPISRACPRPAPLPTSTATRSIRGRSSSASAPPIWRRRWGRAIPVAGGLSQSAVNDKAGARTPLALVIASATLAAVPAVPDRPARRTCRRPCWPPWC